MLYNLYKIHLLTFEIDNAIGFYHKYAADVVARNRTAPVVNDHDCFPTFLHDR